MATCDIPFSVKTDLEHKIQEKLSVSDLMRVAENVSLRYRRADKATQNFQIQSEAEALSYLVARLPATYAANAFVMNELKKRLPDFKPRTILDIGAGPATASLVAHHTFGDFDTMTAVEPNPYLRQAGQAYLAQSLKQLEWNSNTIEQFHSEQDVDMVIASYVFNEIPETHIPQLIEKLWHVCKGAMMIIEPGTPQGAGVIGRIRDWAKTMSDSYILAPCPHDAECPLRQDSKRWCHFSVRTERSKLHKKLKGGDAGFEDEKFSYIILSRTKTLRPSYRLIGHPSGQKVIALEVCGAEGATTMYIAKSHPHYKQARKWEWGDSFDD